MTDPVNHPAHYTEHPSGIECIQITEHMGFNLGNAVKYIWRADLKGSAIEDLEKARWYIDRELTKRDALFPATEPAEEETKAEGLCMGGGDMHPCVLSAGHAGVHTDSSGLRWNYPASSPVVPAPTETGPWQTVDAIQVGVPFEDKEGSQLVKLADGKFGYLSYPRETPETLAKYAPFVAAAEEGWT